MGRPALAYVVDANVREIEIEMYSIEGGLLYGEPDSRNSVEIGSRKTRLPR